MTVGVLVMAHGTPAGPAEIGPFFTRIRHGREPEPEELAALARRYEAIGGTSPLAARTDAQVDGIRRVLEAVAPGRFVVAFGAKHTDPSIEEASAHLVALGVERVIGLVLTPHASSMGSQEYLDRAAAACAASLVPLVVIGPWYAEPALIALWAARISRACENAGPRSRVIFTAHSLPERIRATGDTYPEQFAESAELVAGAAGLGSWALAWQSAPARAREPWLGPDVRDVVRSVAAPGDVAAVVLCPVGFVADHLEVLYDLDIEVAAVAAASGLRYARAASLNDAPAFTALLARLVLAADGVR